MDYMIRHGELFSRSGAQPCGGPLACIHSTLDGQRKEILPSQGEEAPYQTRVCRDEAGANGHRYELCAPSGQLVALGLPGYADGEDPAVYGRPVNRMPRAQHIRVQLGARRCLLCQQDCCHYRLRAQDGQTLLTISHRGLAGGWDLSCREPFPPAVLCGLLVFCLYLDRENEFIAV